MLSIDDDRVELLPADEVWGKGTIATNDWIYARYGKGVGVLNIGPGGENMVNFAVVRSLEGRSGGRPGMGAVMGSKLLKAIVVKGSKPIPQAFPAAMKTLGRDDLRTVHAMDKEAAWSIQGTTGVLPWCNEVAALPVHNFRGTHHPDAWKVDGERVHAARVATYGCPNCTMRCGIAIPDDEGREAEVDYENIGLLGPNLDLYDLAQVAALNWLCDDYGLDTISAGGVLGFYADAIERGAVSGDLRFGDADGMKKVLGMIARREGEIGNLLADGTLRAARAFGHGSEDYAMQVKGLEISAYNCKFIPGMALAFGVSPIGAHHKESWIITYEVKQTTRGSYGRDKAQKIVDLQRIRGGLFESIVTCRFPWVELGWGVEHYPTYFNTITGQRLEAGGLLADLRPDLRAHEALLAARVPGDGPLGRLPAGRLVRSRPTPTRKGRSPACTSSASKYDGLLQHYYDIRGYDTRGVPTRATLESLGLGAEAAAAEAYATLT